MVKELRKGLLINPVTGMSVGLESEFNAEQEQTSRHLVGQLGDMPVSLEELWGLFFYTVYS